MECVSLLKVCSCPDFYDPMCGSDGKMYGSGCFLECAQTHNQFLNFVSNGDCEEPVSIMTKYQKIFSCFELKQCAWGYFWKLMSTFADIMRFFHILSYIQKSVFEQIRLVLLGFYKSLEINNYFIVIICLLIKK